MTSWLNRVWIAARDATRKFFAIHGAQWAHAFAFNALFSLAPLVAVVVAAASMWAEPVTLNRQIVEYIGRYVPVSGQMQEDVLETITGVMRSRGQVGALSFGLLLWVAIQCYLTLILAINRAWGLPVVRMWRAPLKSLVGLAITASAILAGIALPIVWRITRSLLFPGVLVDSWARTLVGNAASFAVVFAALSAFYFIAPRRRMRGEEVWLPALVSAILLGLAKGAFVVYLERFSSLNALYGALGGVMALLLWIDVSGCIVIFGACLCAGHAERRDVALATRPP